MSESADPWTAYQRSRFAAFGEFKKEESPPVMVRVYCEKHGRLVARVVDLPGHGAFLVLNRPAKLSPTVVEMRQDFPPEYFGQVGDGDPHYELLEHPDVRREAVLNAEHSTLDIYLGAWCREGHRLSLELDPLLDTVGAYRQGDRGVTKLTV